MKLIFDVFYLLSNAEGLQTGLYCAKINDCVTVQLYRSVLQVSRRIKGITATAISRHVSYFGSHWIGLSPFHYCTERHSVVT
jgi:hypothetical protein